MQILIYSLFLCLFSIDWLTNELGMLPRYATYYVELYAVIIMAAVIYFAVTDRRIDIDARSATILGFLIAVLLGSAAINTVLPEVLVGGFRSHFKFLPFFLLPLVFRFSDEEIRRQLFVLLGLSCFQTLVATYQKFVQFGDLRTGDVIGGTLGRHASGVLSVWLACMIACVFAFTRAGYRRSFALVS